MTSTSDIASVFLIYLSFSTPWPGICSNSSFFVPCNCPITKSPCNILGLSLSDIFPFFYPSISIFSSHLICDLKLFFLSLLSQFRCRDLQCETLTLVSFTAGAAWLAECFLILFWIILLFFGSCCGPYWLLTSRSLPFQSTSVAVNCFGVAWNGVRDRHARISDSLHLPLTIICDIVLIIPRLDIATQV